MVFNKFFSQACWKCISALWCSERKSCFLYLYDGVTSCNSVFSVRSILVLFFIRLLKYKSIVLLCDFTTIACGLKPFLQQILWIKNTIYSFQQMFAFAGANVCTMILWLIHIWCSSGFLQQPRVSQNVHVIKENMKPSPTLWLRKYVFNKCLGSVAQRNKLHDIAILYLDT